MISFKKQCNTALLALLAVASLQTLPARAQTLPQTQTQTQTQTLGDYILEPMPSWYTEGFTRGRLDISKMMQAGFTRLEAVEVQNQMKDLLEAMPEYMALEKAGLGDELFAHHDTLVLHALATAIKRVKQDKYFESGFKPQPLQPSDFYAVFDMDETLLTQWYVSGTKGPNYRDLDKLPKDSILRPNWTGPDYLSMTPGWEKTFLGLAATPGCKGVIVFSAKEDKAAHAIIDRLRIQGKPLRSFLKGVFTRNYLVRDNNKAEKLSKDLRIIDESLEHVVLVDDNPARVFPSQVDNLREFPKYSPDAYYAARDKKDTASMHLIEQLMPTVLSEFKEAETYSAQHKIPFIKAFYPYSMGGQAELLMLMKQGYTMAKAIEFLRTGGRTLFDPVFYIPPVTP